MSNLMTGAKMLLECLSREGVEVMFGYPGGVTLRSMTRCTIIRSGTSWYVTKRTPRSPHRVMQRQRERSEYAAPLPALAQRIWSPDWSTRMMDSVPIVALTGQVSTSLIGSDAFQEADTFGITRSRPSTTSWSRLSRSCRRSSMRRSISLRPDVRARCWSMSPKMSSWTGHYSPSTDSPSRVQGIHRRAQRPDPPCGADVLGAERPLVYAGGGIISERLRNCATSSKLPMLPRFALSWVSADCPAAHPELHQHARDARQLRRQHGDVQNRSHDRARCSFRRSRDRPAGSVRAPRA